jgi:AmmeMemoRadiSam system protein A
MTESGLDDERGPVLLGLARASIERALGGTFRASQSHPWLHAMGATFVTLSQDGNLRGCIGSLEAHRSLLDDVKGNARAAAFRDPRFQPLGADELESTRIEVSLLSPMEPILVRSQADALAQVKPHVDGLLLEWRRHRGTFLPQVWDSLPDARDFLAQLKLKAGLPQDFWSDEVRLYRYHVTKWSEPRTGQTVN